MKEATQATHKRRAAEAKQMAREHALHAGACLAAGRFDEAGAQFRRAGEYANRATDELRLAAKARDGL